MASFQDYLKATTGTQGSNFDKFKSWRQQQQVQRVEDAKQQQIYEIKNPVPSFNGDAGKEAEWMKANPDHQYSVDYDKRHYDMYNQRINSGQKLNDWETNWYTEMVNRRKLTNLYFQKYTDAESAYMKSNPNSEYARTYDKRHYDMYANMLKSGQKLNDWQKQWYEEMIGRRGYDNQLLKLDAGYEADWMKRNPDAQYSVDYDTRHYELYNDWIMNNKPMNEWQKQWYQEMIERRGLDDYNDPFVQQKHRYTKDRDDALAGEDIALNQGLATMDANAFQQYQAIRQQMSDRGLTDSGIAADALGRAQMGNNQAYQQAYGNSQDKRTEIRNQYTENLRNLQNDELEYYTEQEKLAAEQKKAEQEMLLELQKMQSEQDQWMTQATGYVYVGGKVLQMDGQAVRTIDFMKLSEEARHNLATEGLTAQKNAWDYQLGMDSNNISRERIAADINIAAENMKYKWAQLDLASQEAQADIANAAAALENAARNADTSEMRAQAGVLANQLKTIQSEINSYVKAGKKVPQELKDQLEAVLNKMNEVAGLGN